MRRAVNSSFPRSGCVPKCPYMTCQGTMRSYLRTTLTMQTFLSTHAILCTFAVQAFLVIIFTFEKKKGYYVKSFLSCRKKNVFYIFKIKRGCRLLLAINNNKNASEYNATVIHEARYNWLNTSGCIYFAFCYPLVITGITQPKSVCGSF